MPRATSYLMKFSQPLVHVVASGLALQYAMVCVAVPLCENGPAIYRPIADHHGCCIWAGCW